MKILFIDDEREPTSGLIKAARIDPDADITWVKTSADALDHLRKENWDEIWFDHDLGIAGGLEDTTMVVAQTLAELSFHGDIDAESFATCVIHTQNPVGRQNLMLVLRRWDFRVRHVYL
jgi:hypothetical protein